MSQTKPQVTLLLYLYISDIEALMLLFTPETPPLRRAWPSSTAVAFYGFGDASGSGFGTTLQMLDGGLLYRHGQWSTEQSEKSSNYRELNNLLLGIEESMDQGVLQGGELFMFTDNSTAESSFHKGTTSSRTLFELILRLRRLQMHRDLTLHVLHVSGTCMQAQGTDGLSRGCLDEGVLAGSVMLGFVPLHLSAADRESSLQAWVAYWIRTFPSPGCSPLIGSQMGIALGAMFGVPHLLPPMLVWSNLLLPSISAPLVFMLSLYLA
jgi:hypothetical protein